MNLPPHIRAATVADIEHVIANMRALDAEEQLAGRERAAYARDLVLWQRIAVASFCFLDRAGRPAALLGAYLARPEELVLHGCGTDTMSEVAFSYLRFIRASFVPMLEAAASRGYCAVLKKNTLWRLALTRIGGVEHDEGPHDPFVTLIWTGPRAGATVDAVAKGLVCSPSEPTTGDAPHV